MTAVSAAPRARRRTVSLALAAGAGLALLGAGYVAARITAPAGADLSSLTMVPFAVEPEDETNGAISPDGRTVAYVRSRGRSAEIVVRSDNASSPAVLSGGHSAASGPFDLSWSPDGARVYFQEGFTYRSVAAVGGEPRDELTNVNGAALAPDGKTFAAIRVGTARPEAQLFVGLRDELHLYEPAPVAVPFDCITNFVRFSPDGSRILLWLGCDANGIVIVPVPDAQGKGGPARRLWQTATRSPYGITWLNDSRHVVFESGDFTTPGAVWLGDTLSGRLTHVTEALAPMMPLAAGPDNTVALTEWIKDIDVVELPLAGGTPRVVIQSTRYDGSPAWSPLGQTLAYVANRVEGDEVRIRIGREQSERRLLTLRDFPEPHPNSIRALSISPDGQWLALTAYGAAPVVSSGVWIVPVSGGTPRRVSQQDALALRGTWAPDGRRMAIHQVKEGREELWVANIGQSTSKQVTLPPDLKLKEFEWSPHAEVIAAFESRAEGGPRSIAMIDASSGTLRRMGPVDWSVLTWSRDGTRLYGVAAGAKGSELQALDVTTGVVRTVAAYDRQMSITEDFGSSRRLTWAPDGQSLVTTMITGRSNVWLMKGLQLPRRGPLDRLRTILSASGS
jgi:Tol biopolymer transport system component